MARLTLRISRPRRRLHDDAGSELIELALVLPVLLLILAGIVDFGLLFQRYEAVTNSAREGARVAILPGYGAADVQSRVQNYLTASGLPAASTTIGVTYGTQPLSPGGPTIQVATVTVEYPSSFLYIGALARLFGGASAGSVTLRATSTMRLEAAAGAGS
jgi:Flp pilus assembly protein TadG